MTALRHDNSRFEAVAEMLRRIPAHERRALFRAIGKILDGQDPMAAYAELLRDLGEISTDLRLAAHRIVAAGTNAQSDWRNALH